MLNDLNITNTVNMSLNYQITIVCSYYTAKICICYNKDEPHWEKSENSLLHIDTEGFEKCYRKFSLFSLCIILLSLWYIIA